MPSKLAPPELQDDPPVGDYTDALNNQIIDLALARDKAEKTYFRKQNRVIYTLFIAGTLCLGAHLHDSEKPTQPGFLGFLGLGLTGGAATQALVNRYTRRRGLAYPGDKASAFDEQIYDLTVDQWRFRDIPMWKYPDTPLQAKFKRKVERTIYSS